MSSAGKIFFLFFVVMACSAHALDKSKIIAYPVPFNPNNTVLTVRDDNLAGGVMKVEVMDINGDKVHSGSVSGSTYAWNGRNDKGHSVKPGLYIVKVTIEVPGSTTFERKLIRILVKN